MCSMGALPIKQQLLKIVKEIFPILNNCNHLLEALIYRKMPIAGQCCWDRGQKDVFKDAGTISQQDLQPQIFSELQRTDARANSKDIFLSF